MAAAYPCAAATVAAAVAGARLRDALSALHDAVRDERYLVGRHLVDFGGERAEADEHPKQD